MTAAKMRRGTFLRTQGGDFWPRLAMKQGRREYRRSNPRQDDVSDQQLLNGLFVSECSMLKCVTISCGCQNEAMRSISK